MNNRYSPYYIVSPFLRFSDKLDIVINEVNSECIKLNEKTIYLLNFFKGKKQECMIKSNLRQIFNECKKKAFIIETNKVKHLINQIVEFEIINHCNTSCYMCPREKLPHLGQMNFNKFKSIIRQILDNGIDSFRICGIGEPFLNQNLFSFIKELFFYKRNTHLKLISNGSLLDKNNVKKLAKSDISQIFISFPSLNPEVYTKIMGKLDFFKIKNNILNALPILKDKINILILQNNYNESYIENDIKFWLENGVNYEILKCSNRAGNLKNTNFYRIHKRNMNIRICRRFIQEVFVTYDFKVLACCNDFSRKTIIGDLSFENIVDVLIKKREIIQSGYMPFDICHNCDFYQNDYLISNFFEFI